MSYIDQLRLIVDKIFEENWESRLFAKAATTRACPWCQGTQSLKVIKGPISFRVTCESCGVKGPPGLDAEYAMRWWNDRVTR